MVSEIIKAAVLGVIQGITEWLPVSSTGHLLIVNRFLRLEGGEEFLNMFKVVIQFGSILAVICLYFRALDPFSSKKSKEERLSTSELWIKVFAAAIPAAAAGFLFEDIIDGVLSSPWVIAAALIIYGILFIIIENAKKTPVTNKIDKLTLRQAVGIGLFQTLALIPGTSRSGSTILGGMILGASRPVASGFSFFLAIPVMFGASLFKLSGFGFDLSGGELAVLLVGTAVSFIVSVFAIKFLMEYIRKHDFKAFGIYRICLGIIILLLCMTRGG